MNAGYNSSLQAEAARKRIGAALERLREAYQVKTGRVLNKGDFADFLGIGAQRLYNFINGDREPPFYLLEEIVEKTGIGLGSLAASLDPQPAQSVERRRATARRLAAFLMDVGVPPGREASVLARICGGVEENRAASWLSGEALIDVEAAQTLKESSGPLTLDWIYSGDIESLRPEAAIRLQAALEGIRLPDAPSSSEETAPSREDGRVPAAPPARDQKARNRKPVSSKGSARHTPA